jgi:hypothetical protein
MEHEGTDVYETIDGIDERGFRATPDETSPVIHASSEVAERIIDRYDELVYSMKQSMKDAAQLLDNAINVQTITDRQNNSRSTKYEQNIYYMDELIVTARDLLIKKIAEIEL